MTDDEIAKPIAPELIEKQFKRDPFIPVIDQLAPYRAYDKGYEGRQWEPVS